MVPVGTFSGAVLVSHFRWRWCYINTGAIQYQMGIFPPLFFFMQPREAGWFTSMPEGYD